MINDEHIHVYFKHMQKLRKIQFDEKYQDKRDALMPKVGDIVLYSSFNRNEVLISSGIGKVLEMQPGVHMDAFYRVLNIKENRVYEIMANKSSYNDVISTLESAEDINAYYCGYDSLRGKILTETICKYKSDTEAAMDLFVSMDWRSVEFYSVKKIQLNILE